MSALDKDTRDRLRRDDRDSTLIATAKARARLKNVVIDLWRHQQDIKRGKPEELRKEELPATNPMFAAAMAQVILEYYGIPYRTAVGSITHWSIEEGKSCPACWLETPKPAADGSGWTDRWAFVTDLAIYAVGNKVPLLAGQEFNISGNPRAERAAYHPAAVFDADGALVRRQEPHPYYMHSDMCSLEQMTAVAGNLRGDYVFVTQVDKSGGHSRRPRTVGVHLPVTVQSYVKDFMKQVENT